MQKLKPGHSTDSYFCNKKNHTPLPKSKSGHEKNVCKNVTEESHDTAKTRANDHIAQHYLEYIKTNPSLLDHLITGDESLFQYDCKTKRQNQQ